MHELLVWGYLRVRNEQGQDVPCTGAVTIGGLWDQFRGEVDAFLQKLFPPADVDTDMASGASPAEPISVAPAEVVPSMRRGRAE